MLTFHSWQSSILLAMFWRRSERAYLNSQWVPLAVSAASTKNRWIKVPNCKIYKFWLHDRTSSLVSQIIVEMCFEVITCGPNEAMIISGVFHSPPTFINGGRAFVWPCIQMVQKLSLATMTLLIESRKVYTAQGVPISVTGVAQARSVLAVKHRNLSCQIINIRARHERIWLSQVPTFIMQTPKKWVCSKIIMHKYALSENPHNAKVPIVTPTFTYLKLWPNYNAYFHLLWNNIS